MDYFSLNLVLQHMRCGTPYIFHYIFKLFIIFCSLYMHTYCCFIQETENYSILSLSVRHHTHTHIQTSTLNTKRERKPTMLCFALQNYPSLLCTATHTQIHIHMHTHTYTPAAAAAGAETAPDRREQRSTGKHLCLCVCVCEWQCVYVEQACLTLRTEVLTERPSYFYRARDQRRPPGNRTRRWRSRWVEATNGNS